MLQQAAASLHGLHASIGIGLLPPCAVGGCATCLSPPPLGVSQEPLWLQLLKEPEARAERESQNPLGVCRTRLTPLPRPSRPALPEAVDAGRLLAIWKRSPALQRPPCATAVLGHATAEPGVRWTDLEPFGLPTPGRLSTAD